MRLLPFLAALVLAGACWVLARRPAPPPPAGKDGLVGDRQGRLGHGERGTAGSAGATVLPIVPDQGGSPPIASPSLQAITYEGDANQSLFEQYAVWLCRRWVFPAVAGQYGVGDGTAQFVHSRPWRPNPAPLCHRLEPERLS